MAPKLAAGLLLCLLLACPARAADVEWAAEVPQATDRVWLGPDLYACRLQDWRLEDGLLRCVEGASRNPIRVVHALDVTVGPERAEFEASVVLSPGEVRDRAAAAESCAGLLLGSGGEGIPYQLTALCHSRPAMDGGLAVGVDVHGRVVFRDNETNEAGGSWSIAGKLREGEFLELEASERRDPPTEAAPPALMRLQVRVSPLGASYSLTARVLDAETGETWSEATLHGVGERNVEGNLSLFSHLSPAADGAGWGFSDWRAEGAKLELHEGREFGPVLAAQFTVSRGVLKLTAQLPPLGEQDAQEGTLELREGDEWRPVATARLVPDSFTLPFRVSDWRADEPREYRVRYELRTGAQRSRTITFEGTIPAEPGPAQPLVVAAFTGNKHFTGGIRWNSEGVWFPHTDIVEAVRSHDPHLLFFSGDQIYEGDLTAAQTRPDDKARLDYLDKWYRWCWAFRDLTRDRPTICIPDDHDVYHGNLWGAGGRHADKQDDGGYKMPARFVQMVERTQTSHLPDPFDPTPVEQGIGVYYTSLDYGGVSFAILEDRKFKSCATPLIPEGECVNGWFQAEDFDPVTQSDVPGAVLLGERQLDFLRSWTRDWSDDTWLKCALSQTIFCNVATLPPGAKSGSVLPSLATLPPGEYAEGQLLAADTDSNGWPRSGRDRAVRELRRSGAFHIAGDQHLGSLVRYGVERQDDAGFAFCVPSIANTWPRRWFPPTDGADRAEGAPRYTGCFEDGFGNKVRVLAVSNPRKTGVPPEALHDRAPGYGIVRFDKRAQEVVVECWPRWSDPTSPDARQYDGWPRRLAPYRSPARAHALPDIELSGLVDPLVEVWRTGDDGERELLEVRRVHGERVQLELLEPGTYDLLVRPASGSEGRWLRGLVTGPGPARRLEF